MQHLFTANIRRLSLILFFSWLACTAYSQNTDTNTVKIRLHIYDSIDYTVQLERAYSTEYYNRDSSIAISPRQAFIRQTDLMGPAMPGCNLYSIVITHPDGRVRFKLPLPMKGGDSIYVDITDRKIPGWGNLIKVAGSNGAAHNFMLQNTNALTTKVFDAESQGLQGFYIAAHQYIDSICTAFRKICLELNVDTICRDFYLTDLKSKLYHETLNELGNILHRDSVTYERTCAFLNLKNLIFYEGGAHNPLLLKTFNGSGLYDSYLSYLMEINPVKDSLLCAIRYGYFSLYDSSYRSFAWGQHLYYGYKMWSKRDLQKRFAEDQEFKVFKEKEPNSPYISFLEKYVYGQLPPFDNSSPANDSITRTNDPDSISPKHLQ